MNALTWTSNDVVPVLLAASHRDDMKVCTNGHRYELHTLSEAADVEFAKRGQKALDRLHSDFDYIEDSEEPRLVWYRRSWVDTSDMSIIPRVRPEGGALDVLATQGWHVFAAESFWSATLCRFLDGDDWGFVRMGTATW
jgi:hypothetical protein